MVLSIIIYIVVLLLIFLVAYCVICYAPGEESRKEEYDRCICCGKTFPKGWVMCPHCLVYIDEPK